MHKILLAAVLILLSFCHSSAQTDSAAMAGQIIILEQKLADALPGDSATWSKYTDPKWHLVDEDGRQIARKDFLAGFNPFPSAVSGNILVTKPVLTFHGDVAVIQYVADEHEIFYGQHLHTTYGTMDTWYKKDTSWVMLAMEDFEIPALPPVLKIDAKELQPYTGVYQMAGLTATITLDKDTLFIQKPKRKPEALFAETKNVFFRKSDARGRKIFVKDDAGNMLMLERRNGQDVIWKRMK
jgi:hypothetical protein